MQKKIAKKLLTKYPKKAIITLFLRHVRATLSYTIALSSALLHTKKYATSPSEHRVLSEPFVVPLLRTRRIYRNDSLKEYASPNSFIKKYESAVFAALTERYEDGLAHTADRTPALQAALPFPSNGVHHAP